MKINTKELARILEEEENIVKKNTTYQKNYPAAYIDNPTDEEMIDTATSLYLDLANGPKEDQEKLREWEQELADELGTKTYLLGRHPEYNRDGVKYAEWLIGKFKEEQWTL
jgi:hypothetical protein